MNQPTVTKKNLEELIIGSFSSHLTTPFDQQTPEDLKRAKDHAINVIEFMEQTNLFHPELK